eukprot:CAMPEP_0173201254 /NCGR_PEP_ID=MMETSP1141-20130122/18247_1 /TAXON_ID=483371 /ORGANISM="non described non described, Strain CCMP2298" /LENGTH=149 /DNA_ID=CAMNT_0014126351 /DNA_START=25 /DNA_END=474 /DNA_ORIENTATION=-
MIQPGMHVQQGFNKTAMSSGCETQMPFTITIEEPTELPNGMYAEGTLFGGGGFKVHCPAGTTYTAVCELVRNRYLDVVKVQMIKANEQIAQGGLAGRSAISTSVTIQVLGCDFKGGPVSMGASAVAGEHTLKLAQTTSIAHEIQCCVIF